MVKGRHSYQPVPEFMLSDPPDLEVATDRQADALAGCLLGTAIGDALGLPYEGLSRRRALRMLGPPSRHRFLCGWGMVSDDTEHTCLVAQSLIASAGEPDIFERELARRLRWWLIGLPAGAGKATAIACLRLWLGVGPARSGVFSAGSGPAMRAAILGVAIDPPEQMAQIVHLNSQITHSDPKAEYAALAVARAAHVASTHGKLEPAVAVELVLAGLPEGASELGELLERAAVSAQAGESTQGFAASLGLGKAVSGYAYHVVPVSLHAWLRHPRDYAAAVTAVIECGGDADTTAAITGGIVGAAVGPQGIPDVWLDRLAEWSRSQGWLMGLSGELHRAMRGRQAGCPPRLPAWGLLPRNILFLLVVLFHGFRRLLPPY